MILFFYRYIFLRNGGNIVLQLYKNIKSRRQSLGLTQADLASLTGYADKSMIAKIEKGLVDLPQSKIQTFADALHTTASALMGTEVMLPSNIIPMPTMRRIPLLGSIACGEPILAQENLEGDVDVPDHVHADFALRCRGDSMINARIFDGDIVYIRRQDEVEDGQIAAVLIGDEATLKRVRLFPDHLSLEPENPRYRPIVLWGEEMSRARILGLAVAFTSPVQ